MFTRRSTGLCLLLAASTPSCREQTDVSEPTVAPAAAPLDLTSTARARARLDAARKTFAAESLLASDPAVKIDASSATAVLGDARVTLPNTLNGTLSLRSASMAIDIRPRDAAATPIEWADGVAVFAGDGVDVFRRFNGKGVEDLYAVREKRDSFETRYDVTLQGVAGLRVVGGSLELLERDGTPRLRVPAPIAIGSDGKRAVGAIDVEGCTVDRDAVGPWGRPVAASGAERCTVVARIATDKLAFPILVDPAWETTASMTYTRYGHVSLLITGGTDDGKVLVAGGGGTYTASTELYDPVSKTWSAGSLLPAGSDLGFGARGVVLASGTVVLTGGIPSSTTEPARRATLLRDATTGTWSAGASMATGRGLHAMARVTIAGKERVIVGGGQPAFTVSDTANMPLASAEMYAPDTDTWSAIGFLRIGRTQMSTVVLGDGRVAIIGGDVVTSSGFKQADTTEVYDATLDDWLPGPKLTTRRAGMAAALISGSKALVAGGHGGSGIGDALLDTAEIVDFAAGTSTALTTKLSQARRELVATSLGDGRVLLSGGQTGTLSPYPKAPGTTYVTPSTFVDMFAPTPTPALTAIAVMNQPRVLHAVTLMPSGIVLASGGWTATAFSSQTKTAELLNANTFTTCTTSSECTDGRSCVDGVCCATSSCPTGQVCNASGREGSCVKTAGQACTTAAECATGFCAQGVCCTSACTAGCRSCALAGTEGTCTMAAAGTDPRDNCTGGHADCRRFCNGSGSCGSYKPAGTPCGSTFCAACAGSSGTCNATGNVCGLTCVNSGGVTCSESAMSCSIAAGYTLKANTCLIDGKCYASGDTKGGDSCFLCDPGTSTATWTVALGCDAGPIDAGSDAPADTESDAADSTVADTTPADTATDDTATEDTATPIDSSVADTSVADASADTATPAEPLPEADACSCSVPGTSRPNSTALAALGVIGALVKLRRRARRVAASAVVASLFGCSANAGRDETPPSLDKDTGLSVTDTGQGFDVSMDVSTDETLGDAACVGVTTGAIKPPVDIIVVVDQSGSMSEEIVQVRTNINKLADQLEKAYLDYHVVMIAGISGTYSVCVPPPLGGSGCKSNPPIFRASDQHIESTDSLDWILKTYDSVLPSTGWRDMLREEATKIFIPVTDDNATTPKPVAPSATVAEEFDKQLLSRSATMFGTPDKRKYRFYPICGASAADPTMKCGTGMVNVGQTYLDLAKISGGKYYPLCTADYGPMFIELAKALAGEVACELTIPAPPDGSTVDLNKVNVIMTAPDGKTKSTVPQDNSAPCAGGANGWQYSGDNKKIILCGDACTKVKNDFGTKVDIQFGCNTRID